MKGIVCVRMVVCMVQDKVYDKEFDTEPIWPN